MIPIARSKARQDGLCLVFLGAMVISLLLSYILLFPTLSAFNDFKESYFAARCLIQDSDPYNARVVLREYLAGGGENPNESEISREIVSHYMYPPSTLTVIVPFAMLPWRIARVIWSILSTGGLLLGSLLAWDLGADFAPILSGAFIGFLLANSLVITVLCNPSGLAVGLCVIAVWCFMRNRFVFAGIPLLALSLAIKPQDAGFVWLYFLLAGGVHRKRAFYVLLVTIAVAVPAVVWVGWVAPHWIPELHSNLLAFAGHGGLIDPGPASTGAGTMINLQVVFSWLWDNPHFYDLTSYSLFAFLLLVWVWVTLRSPFSTQKAWFAIAAIVPLSMLPIYHQLYSTKLLLLTVPVMAILWTAGGLMKWVSLFVQAAAFMSTGDLSGAIYRYLIAHLLPHATAASSHTVKALAVIPVPIILLIMGVFYLWAYFQHAFNTDTSDATIGDRVLLDL